MFNISFSIGMFYYTNWSKCPVGTLIFDGFRLVFYHLPYFLDSFLRKLYLILCRFVFLNLNVIEIRLLDLKNCFSIFDEKNDLPMGTPYTFDKGM